METIQHMSPIFTPHNNFIMVYMSPKFGSNLRGLSFLRVGLVWNYPLWIMRWRCAWSFALCAPNSFRGITGSGSSPLFRFRILLATQTRIMKRVWPATLLIIRSALISLPLCYVSSLTTVVVSVKSSSNPSQIPKCSLLLDQFAHSSTSLSDCKL